MHFISLELIILPLQIHFLFQQILNFLAHAIILNWLWHLLGEHRSLLRVLLLESINLLFEFLILDLQGCDLHHLFLQSLLIVTLDLLNQLSDLLIAHVVLFLGLSLDQIDIDRRLGSRLSLVHLFGKGSDVLSGLFKLILLLDLR